MKVAEHVARGRTRMVTVRDDAVPARRLHATGLDPVNLHRAWHRLGVRPENRTTTGVTGWWAPQAARVLVWWLRNQRLATGCGHGGPDRLSQAVARAALAAPEASWLVFRALDHVGSFTDRQEAVEAAIRASRERPTAAVTLVELPDLPGDGE